MATRCSLFIDEFRQGVTCLQCQQLYKTNNSRLLPCLHIFCVDCICKLPVEETVSTEAKALDQSTINTQKNGNYLKADETDENDSLELETKAGANAILSKSIKCPLCQKNCQLPEKGVDSFQTPVIISDHLTILENLENLTREGGPKCCHCHDSPRAVAYCYQHRYLICELCQKMHETWVDYSSHKVVSIEELTRASDANEQGEQSQIEGEYVRTTHVFSLVCNNFP